jgi:hypothetical protein
MAKYNGSGWHLQSIRHSNARKYGKAGGKYATKLTITHHEAKPSQRYKQLPIYKFEEAPENLKQKILDNYREINVDYDWWDFDGLIDPSQEDVKKLSPEDKKRYDKVMKSGKSVFKYKIGSFDLDRSNYLQLENVEPADEQLFFGILGLTKAERKKIYKVKPYNDNNRETDTKIEVWFDEDAKITDDEKERIEQKVSGAWSDIIHQAKKDLRKDYEYNLSDEAIKETLIANEYDFDEKGKIA